MNFSAGHFTIFSESEQENLHGHSFSVMLPHHLNYDSTIIEQIKGMNAQNRLIEPAEIAQIIYFAATNSVINGAILHANMGQKES